MKKYATRDCCLAVGDPDADVRVTVSSVDGLMVNVDHEVVS